MSPTEEIGTSPTTEKSRMKKLMDRSVSILFDKNKNLDDNLQVRSKPAFNFSHLTRWPHPLHLERRVKKMKEKGNLLSVVC
jgi:hypothetical protein